MNTSSFSLFEIFQVIETWFLQTKAGETVCTDRYGLYLDRTSSELAADTIIEVLKNTDKDFKDSKGNVVAVGEYFVDVNGKTEFLEEVKNIATPEERDFLELDKSSLI